jgi:hypothetical protein
MRKTIVFYQTGFAITEYHYNHSFNYKFPCRGIFYKYNTKESLCKYPCAIKKELATLPTLFLGCK